MGKIYGYCRVSTKNQNIDRQIRNIKTEYPNAVIISEAYTGTTIERPKWIRLCGLIKAGDTIVFDSVSRMSRNSEEGCDTYFKLFDSNIKLVFLKEHYIDTDIYKNNIQDRIKLVGTDEDEIFQGINNYFRKLAVKQIRIAFEQAEKEVKDLQQRTREGIETARLNGKQIGQKRGVIIETNKSKSSKDLIKKYSKDFGGTLNDKDVIRLIGISRNSYYKYKKQLTEYLQMYQ